jgi:hypothetical protein
MVLVSWTFRVVGFHLLVPPGATPRLPLSKRFGMCGKCKSGIGVGFAKLNNFCEFKIDNIH